MIKDWHGINEKLIVTCNPLANAMVIIHQMIQMLGITGKLVLYPDFESSQILCAIRQAAQCAIHTAHQATPAQPVHGPDAVLNAGLKVD